MGCLITRPQSYRGLLLVMYHGLVVSLLELDGVTWPGGPVGGLSLRLAAGETLSLEVPAAAALGRRLMGGAPGAGRVLLNGEDLAGLLIWQRARRGLLLVSADLPALPGLDLSTLVRAGLAARYPAEDRPKTLQAVLARRGAELGLAPEALARRWDAAPDPATGWKLALLVAERLRPQLPIFCPPDAAAARCLADREGSSLLLLEEPADV